MANQFSSDDLQEFLDHAGDRGLMPVATAQALAVASRNVLGVLSDSEKKNLDQQDIDSVIKRFHNKRAKDFSPSSLKEYARRLHRAVELFLAWRENPADFQVKTRSTAGARRREKTSEISGNPVENSAVASDDRASRAGTYRSAIPVRPGVVVTLADIPYDLTKAEAERLASFVRMLAVGS